MELFDSNNTILSLTLIEFIINSPAYSVWPEKCSLTDIWTIGVDEGTGIPGLTIVRSSSSIFT